MMVRSQFKAAFIIVQGEVEMAARTRKPVAQPEPEVVEETEETGSQKRGPSALTLAFVEWLKVEHDVVADPEVVYLAQTERRAFRQSDIYEKYMDEEDARKEAAAADKAKRAEERAARAAEATEAPAEETAPAPRARRTRAAKTEVVEAAPAAEPAKPARRTRAKSAAPAGAETDTTTEAPAAAPAKRTRKAPF